MAYVDSAPIRSSLNGLLTNLTGNPIPVLRLELIHIYTYHMNASMSSPNTGGASTITNIMVPPFRV